MKTTRHKAFALYKLPNQKECFLTIQEAGEPVTLEQLEALNSLTGFVMAPFHISAQEPVIVIQGKTVAYHPGTTVLPPCQEGDAEAPAREGFPTYASDFHHFHQALLQNSFHKLVLSRQDTSTNGGIHQAEAYFQEASQRYPHMMVALVSAPQCGTWLMATPEILLQGTGNRWRTMALAGTMPLDNPESAPTPPSAWNGKNKEEQRLVADYIEERLKRFTHAIEREPVHTEKAGNVAHLCTIFRFSLPHTRCVGALLDSLHPTPAVCGLPKEEALNFIRAEESAPRHYYSGFAGPLDTDGHTDLFVSLRCMRLLHDRCELHAGGGLLPESVLENEWHETEQKLETMKLCIAASPT